MGQTDFLTLLRLFTNLVLGACLTLPLIKFRMKKRKSVLVICATYLCIYLVQVILVMVYGLETVDRLYGLITHPLIFLGLLAVSAHGVFKTLFSQITMTFFYGLLYTPARALASLAGGDMQVLLEILIRLVLFWPVLWFELRVFRGPYMELQNRLDKGWGLFCLPPLMMAIAFFAAPAWWGTMGIPIQFFWQLLSLFIYAVFYYMFRQLSRQLQAEYDNRLLRQQIEGQKQQYDAMKRQNELSAQHRHDLRHYIQVLHGLLGADKTDEALAYMATITQQLEETVIERYCGNEVLNVLLSAYAERLARTGAALEVQLRLPARLPLDDVELSVLLANALENASENMDPGTVASVTAWQDTTHLGITIKNPCSRVVTFDNDGLPLSTKPGGGLGLKSMREIVRHNNGILDFAQEDGWFSVRVLLPIAADPA